jgi:hypothetical protein
VSLHVESILICATYFTSRLSLLVLLFPSLHDDLATVRVLLIVEQNPIPEKRNKLEASYDTELF